MELKALKKLIVNGHFELAADFFENLSEQSLNVDAALSDKYACISMYLTTHCLKLTDSPMYIRAKKQNEQLLTLKNKLEKKCIELNTGLEKLNHFVSWISEISDVSYHPGSIRKTELITIWSDFKRNIQNKNIDKLFKTIWLLKANLAEHVTFQSEIDIHQDIHSPKYTIKKGKYLEYYRKIQEIDKIEVLISDVVIFKDEFDKLKTKFNILKDNAGIREQVHFENQRILLKIENYLKSNFPIDYCNNNIRQKLLITEKVEKTAPTFTFACCALVGC